MSKSLPGPVIAKVNGATLGGGTGLICACDYVLAAKSAKMGFTEVKLGLVPAVISPFVMAKIGESNARAYFLSGEIFTSEKGQELGMVHKVTPLDNLNDETEKVVRNFLLAGPQAAREAKALVRNVMQKKTAKEAEKITAYTCQTIARIRTGEEGQEGMTALLDKRKPNWVGED